MDAEPFAVEPAVAPVPLADVPKEKADARAVIADSVHRTPEQNIFVFPLLGNKVLIGEQIVEDVGIQNGLARQLLAEIVAFERLVVLLAVREPELDLRGGPFE